MLFLCEYSNYLAVKRVFQDECLKSGSATSTGRRLTLVRRLRKASRTCRYSFSPRARTLNGSWFWIERISQRTEQKEPTKDSETSFVEGSRSRGDTDSETRLEARNLVQVPSHPWWTCPIYEMRSCASSIKDVRCEEEEVCGQVRWHAIDSSTNFCICRWVVLQESRFLETCRESSLSRFLKCPSRGRLIRRL